MPLFKRHAETLVKNALEDFRVTVVNGPRQSGKSTLLGQLGGVVVNLDDRTVLRTARSDPTGFLSGYPRPLFIDEVQRGGDPLVLAIKAAVDRNNRSGEFVLAGSSRFLTVPTLSESLAGRARIVDLWPLSQGELTGGADAFVDRLFGPSGALDDVVGERLSRRSAMERVVLGGFPAIHQISPRGRRDWFEDYRRTLIERDLTDLRRIRQTSEMARLVQLSASLTAQEVNVSTYADLLGLASGTAKDYLALLEVIYVHYSLPSWAASFVTRSKRRPKLHFVDSGLAADTIGLSVDRIAIPGATEAGPLLETFVVGEVMRQVSWSIERPSVFHFRDREQREVDIVLESRDGRIAAIEVKAAMDVDEGDTKWVRWLRDNLGERFINGVVVYLGERPQPLGDRITAVPLSSMWA